VKSLELEEWKVWRHELKGKHPIFFFSFFFFLFGFVGAITNFGQKLVPLIFFLFYCF
jgi:hypothetical protein